MRRKCSSASPADREFSRFFRGEHVGFLKIFLTVVGPSFRRIAPPEAVASAGNAYRPPPQGHCAVLMSSCRTWEVSSGAATRLFCGIGVLWLLLPSFHFLSAHPCTSRDRFGSAQERPKSPRWNFSHHFCPAQPLRKVKTDLKSARRDAFSGVSGDAWRWSGRGTAAGRLTELLGRRAARGDLLSA